MNVTGSRGSTPNRKVLNRLELSAARIRPRTPPTNTRVIPRDISVPTTPLDCAPNESRIPTSRVRCATEKLTTPKMPIQASTIATSPKIAASTTERRAGKRRTSRNLAMVLRSKIISSGSKSRPAENIEKDVATALAWVRAIMVTAAAYLCGNGR